MSRPQKRGLSYFPFDTDFYDQVEPTLLFNAHGHIGIAFYVHILCEIYKKEGVFISDFPMDALNFSAGSLD